jgi:hypothetical protein
LETGGIMMEITIYKADFIVTIQLFLGPKWTKSGSFPAKSMVSASAEETPCFPHVER